MTPHPRIAPGEPIGRIAREEREAATLRAGATSSHGAGHRPARRSPTPSAPASSATATGSCTRAAFRRLAGKTQVVVHPRDHERTRLTHALEVAQVATSIARGSVPTWPSPRRSRSATTAATAPAVTRPRTRSTASSPGGYDHGPWGADVVLAPLNLCRETLDGIRNHSWSRPAPASIEGEIVSWSDRIAYCAHDLEDAVHAGIVDAERPAR